MGKYLMSAIIYMVLVSFAVIYVSRANSFRNHRKAMIDHRVKFAPCDKSSVLRTESVCNEYVRENIRVLLTDLTEEELKQIVEDCKNCKK